MQILPRSNNLGGYYRIKITDEQREHAWAIVNKKNYGQRASGFNGDKVNQYVGMLAETVVADLFEQPRPTEDKPYDFGKDFEHMDKIIDLKTMGHTKSYAHPMGTGCVNAEQYDDPRRITNIYLFSTLNKATNELDIIGWVKKWEVKSLGTFCPKGIPVRQGNFNWTPPCDTWTVPHNKMRKFTTSFFAEMETFGF